eukprot:scaffold221915_cov27-Attheya_sp.AAC.2
MERTEFSPLQPPTVAFVIGRNNGSLDLGSLANGTRSRACLSAIISLVKPGDDPVACKIQTCHLPPRQTVKQGLEEDIRGARAYEEPAHLKRLSYCGITG